MNKYNIPRPLEPTFLIAPVKWKVVPSYGWPEGERRPTALAQELPMAYICVSPSVTWIISEEGCEYNTAPGYTVEIDQGGRTLKKKARNFSEGIWKAEHWVNRVMRQQLIPV